MAGRNFTDTPRSVLVVVCNTGLGDAVESLPVFSIIRQRWPHVRLAAGYFREKQRLSFALSPHTGEHVPLSGNARYGWPALKGLPWNVRHMRGYDVVLFLYKTEAVAWPLILASKIAGARPLYKHGYRYRDQGRTSYSDFPEHVFFQIVAANLLLRSPLIHVIEPQIELSESDERLADAFFDRHGLRQRPTVFINNSQPPDWGIEKYAQLANRLVALGADVIFNGGSKYEIKMFRSVADQLSAAVVLLEKPSPGELAAVIRRCDLFIGFPNGPASLALAVGTPTITLFGPGEHGYAGQHRIGPPWWPRGATHQVISKIDWCQTTMSAVCTSRQEALSYMNWRSRLTRKLKYFGLWGICSERVKTFMRAMRALPDVYVCFEAITVQEVLDAAIQQLVQRTGHRMPCGQDGSFERAGLHGSRIERRAEACGSEDGPPGCRRHA